MASISIICARCKHSKYMKKLDEKLFYCKRKREFMEGFDTCDEWKLDPQIEKLWRAAKNALPFK